MKKVTEEEFLARPDPLFETAAHGEPVAILRDEGCGDVVLVNKRLYELLQAIRDKQMKEEFAEFYAEFGDVLRALADR